MPPRWLCLVIVTFWLGTTGWLFWHDLWPQLQPGQPPPFSIDLVEEAQTRRPYILWGVEQNGERCLKARTGVEHPRSGVFELVADLTPQHGMPGVSISGCQVRRIRSRYRVTAEGRLLGLSVQIEATPQLFAAFKPVKGDFTIDVRGDVEAGEFRPRLRVESAAGQTLQANLPSTPVSARGSVLLPMHPVNRIRGLKPGQRWRQVVLDPLEDSLRALLHQGGEPRTLEARVRPRLEEYQHAGRRNSDCLVVDYAGEDMKAQTWVEEKTGLVLRQDATFGGTHLAMYRE
jgi:hypothetical protein